MVLWQIQVGETSTTNLRMYFQLVQTDGITPATGEAGGQPQIVVNNGSWTSTGIGTLVHLGNGRYFAVLDTATVQAGTIASRILTRYKSASTAECPGDCAVVVNFSPTNFSSALSSTIIAGVWDRLLANITTESTIGKLIKDNLDAAISSRLATAGYTAPDNVGIDTLESRLTAQRATNLDNLDANQSAQSATLVNLAADVGEIKDSQLILLGSDVDAIFNRLGAPVGASMSADIAAVKAQTAAIETDTQDLQNRTPAALVSGRMDAHVGAMANDVITNSSIAADAIGSSELAASAGTEIGTAVEAVLSTQLDAIQAKTDLITASGSTPTSNQVDDLGNAEVTRGFDHTIANGRALRFPVSATPNLSTASSLLFTDENEVAFSATVTASGAGTANQEVVVELTAAQATALRAGPYSSDRRFKLKAVVAGADVLLGSGWVKVL